MSESVQFVGLLTVTFGSSQASRSAQFLVPRFSSLLTCCHKSRCHFAILYSRLFVICTDTQFFSMLDHAWLNARATIFPQALCRDIQDILNDICKKGILQAQIG